MDVWVGRLDVGPAESKSTGQCCGDFRPGDVPVRLERPVRITDEERLVIYRGRRHNGWRHNGWRYNRWRHNGWRHNRWRYNGWRYNGWRYNRWRRSDVVCEGDRGRLSCGQFNGGNPRGQVERGSTDNTVEGVSLSRCLRHRVGTRENTTEDLRVEVGGISISIINQTEGRCIHVGPDRCIQTARGREAEVLRSVRDGILNDGDGPGWSRSRGDDVVGEGGSAGPVDGNDHVHRRITGSNPASRQSALGHGVRPGDDRNSVRANTAIRGDVKRRYIVHTTGDGEVERAVSTGRVLDDLQRTHGIVVEIDRGSDGAIIHGGSLHHGRVIGDPAGGQGAFGHIVGTGGDGNIVDALADSALADSGGGDVERRHNIVHIVGDGEVERVVTTDRVLDDSDGPRELGWPRTNGIVIERNLGLCQRY